ncbi:MAG TPA: PQQ-binding-like beta-propeller repeat protein [Mycobacteriales bacterium]|nr:PQQ-binding-like beta-propeller repeat protein [Mycobacteriales bacterium]
MRKLVVLCLTTFIALMLAAPSADAANPLPAANDGSSAGDWPGIANDPSLSGDNRAESAITPANVHSMKAAWTSRGAGGLFSTTIVAAQRLFVNELDGGVTALNALTGRKLWSWNDSRSWGIAASGGLLYVSTDRTTVHGRITSGVVALDQATGKVRWTTYGSFTDQYQPWGSPTVGNGRIYASFDGGLAVALDPATGKVLWKRGASRAPADTVGSSFSYSDERLYAATGSGSAVFSAVTGRVLWHYDSGHAIPRIMGSRGIVTGNQSVVAMPAGGCGQPTCKPLWVNKDYPGATSVALTKRYVVLGLEQPAGTPSIAILDIASGKTLWRGYGPRGAFVAVAGQTIFATDGSDGIGVAAFALDGCGKARCRPLWSGTYSTLGSIPSGPPIVSHGTLYYSTVDINTPEIIAFRPPVATVDGPAYAYLGHPVTITGTAPAGATVSVWFHRRGASSYVKSRTVRADAFGVWTTTYHADEDYLYYATSGTSTSRPALTRIVSTISGPSHVRAGHKATIRGIGRPRAVLHIWFHRRNAGGYVMRRTVRADAAGHWTTSFTADTDYRYYAVDIATGQPTPSVRTLGR